VPQVTRKVGDFRVRLTTDGRTIFIAGLLALAAVAAACGSTGPASKSADKPTTTATTSPPTTTARVSTAAVQALLKQGIDEANAKQVNQAVTTFNDVLLLSPKNTYALYNLGLINQLQKDTSGALDYYKRALASNPKYTPAMYNEAILLEPTDLNAALALYQTIVKINPKASTAYLRMAFVYSKQGKTAQADAARAKAVALDPSLAKYPMPAKCSTPNC